MGADPKQMEKIWGPDPMLMALRREGITMGMLAKDLKRGLTAKVTKTLKIKGALPDKLPKGYRIISTSGTAVYNKKTGKLEACDGETVIQWEEIAHSERTTNRIDAERLGGLYRPEKHEVDVKRAVLIIEGLNDDDKPK